MSEGIKFLYEFSVGAYDVTNPGVNILSVTSTAAGDHSKTNLTTTALRETWRSDAVDVAQEIVIEANDTDTVINVFAILNHNLSENAVVTLYANTTNSFVSPALTVPFTWNDKHLVLSQDFGTAYRYFKIKIVDPLNACGYVEIGKIIAGRAFTFTTNEDVTDDFSVSTDDLAYQMKTEGFFRASNERVKVDKYQIKFDKLTTQSGQNDNYLGLMAMTRTVGITLPFLTIIDPGDPYFGLVWGQLDSVPSRNFTINRYTSLSLSIQEVY